MLKNYEVVKDAAYNFGQESYGKDVFPNIHRYPATMLPQIGIKVLKDLKINRGSMLDPYCGSGSSFACGLHCGVRDLTGFDLNPLALLITKSKFTRIEPQELKDILQKIKKDIGIAISQSSNRKNIDLANFSNINYWFNPEIAHQLQLIKNIIGKIKHVPTKDFLFVALSSTIRDCSYTRNNEFKLYRMKEDVLLKFNPDVLRVFLSHLQQMIEIYTKYYYHLLEKISLELHSCNFQANGKTYDIVLTSPPYGDSRTTVAYGQFSAFANAWVCGLQNARELDRMLMGGVIPKEEQKLFGLMNEYIEEINRSDEKRSMEVQSFYVELAKSIHKVSKSITKGGYAVYVVGNRTVKGIKLPTDQFIAEQFEKNGLNHIVTYERTISNKRMPKLNSPTNQPGKKMSTMNHEYIVLCRKAN